MSLATILLDDVREYVQREIKRARTGNVLEREKLEAIVQQSEHQLRIFRGRSRALALRILREELKRESIDCDQILHELWKTIGTHENFW